MNVSEAFLQPAEAAEKLGISAKALRLYEQRGLVTPPRAANGWRTYGPAEMQRAGEIVALRRLGLSLAGIARMLDGDASDLDPVLAAHQAALQSRLTEQHEQLARVRDLRAGLAEGRQPTLSELVQLDSFAAPPAVAFDLPWPWDGERFELRAIKPITYLVGPLGSGKTRLAKRLAETLPGAIFLPMERLPADGDAIRAQLAADPALRTAVDADLAWLAGDDVAATDALTLLLIALHHAGPVVVDMVEEGLDQKTQEALIARLRHRNDPTRPLILMTRSSSILDLAQVGPDEAILFCPANHSPPISVLPYPGSPGHEALSTCLATPDVRTRTAGVIAMRPAG